MGKIYKNQNQLRFTATAGVDITGATVTEIKYQKADGTTGTWTATIEDALTGVIYYDVTGTDELDVLGDWQFWAWVTFSDGRSAPGEPFTKKIYAEGS